MNKVENVNGFIIRPLGDMSEDFKIKGLLLPKDEVSRNNVLYDWDSVKAKSKEFEGVTLNYNHLTDDDKPPIGKITKTFIKEKEDADGKAGVYYEAEVDENSEYADSIKKGYLNKVSIQVMASAQKTEKNEDGESYTRAFIGSPLEVSVVKVPGFSQTTMEVALAEAFKREENKMETKESVSTTLFNNLNNIRTEFKNEENKMEEKTFIETYKNDLKESKTSFEKIATILEALDKRVSKIETVDLEESKAAFEKITTVLEAFDKKMPKEESMDEDEETKKEEVSDDEDKDKEAVSDEEDKDKESMDEDETKKESDEEKPKGIKEEKETSDEDKKEEVDEEKETKKEEVSDDEDKDKEAVDEETEEEKKKETVDDKDNKKAEAEDDAEEIAEAEEEKDEKKPKAPKMEKLDLKSIKVKSTFKRTESFLTK